MTTLETIPLWIDGGPTDARSGRRFATDNPATGKRLAEVQEAGLEDVDAAVAAAKAAFPAWSRMTGAERGRILHRAAQILRSRNDAIARLEVLDTGKPISEALAVDVASGADCLEFFAGVAPAIAGEHIDLGGGGGGSAGGGGAFAYTRREPLGVCAGIGAWNYPIQIACWKAAPALACGNTMVFKPSEATPVTAIELARALAEAGAPPGVFNIVQGAAETGAALVGHPDVAKVSLTGSVPTGKRAMAAAAATLKHVTMELGGKSPLLVFEDAHIDNAVSAALNANFYTQGEICSNGTRVFLHRRIRDAFVDAMMPRIQRMRIGDPMDPATTIGALISRQHMEKVLGFVDSGLKQGAKLLCGGARVTDGACADGWFVAPTVFEAPDDSLSIVREEIFGPVMTLLVFDDEDGAVARANATPFGLAAGLFTRDLARAHRVAARLEAGTVWVNDYNLTPIEMPFGGVKQSGLGRENGLAAIEHYTQRKSVFVQLGDVATAFL
ncbi:betaine-aldehyde dehydrogenase [Thalassobaculum sp.]|uniref:betaine-aldehyde dehydrogenase n=1 Tax=Thalassobaculum sp. TaxID=2022740 RepID=UPI0032EFF897